MLSSMSLPKLSSSVLRSPRLRIASGPPAALAPVITSTEASATLTMLDSRRNVSMSDLLRASSSPRVLLTEHERTSIVPKSPVCSDDGASTTDTSSAGSSLGFHLPSKTSSLSSLGSFGSKFLDGVVIFNKSTQRVHQYEHVNENVPPPIQSEHQLTTNTLRVPLPSVQLLFPIGFDADPYLDEPIAEHKGDSGIRSSALIISDEPLEASVQLSDDIDSPSYDARFLSLLSRIQEHMLLFNSEEDSLLVSPGAHRTARLLLPMRKVESPHAY